MHTTTYSNFAVIAFGKQRGLQVFHQAGFKRLNLERLIEGEHVALEVRSNRIRMLGAIRASQQCIHCHQATRGELLGAFSYELVRAQPIDPSTRDES